MTWSYRKLIVFARFDQRICYRWCRYYYYCCWCCCCYASVCLLTKKMSCKRACYKEKRSTEMIIIQPKNTYILCFNKFNKLTCERRHFLLPNAALNWFHNRIKTYANWNGKGRIDFDRLFQKITSEINFKKILSQINRKLWCWYPKMSFKWLAVMDICQQIEQMT